MNETTRYNIENKIFTKSNINNIGRIFLDEYEYSRNNNNHSSITFRLDCKDNTSYESEDMGIFDDGNIIDIKKLKAIVITYQNYAPRKYMNISLTHGGGYNNTLIVSGDDRNWVNGSYVKVKEIIDSTKPQDNWMIRHQNFLYHINALGFGIIIYYILIAMAWFFILRNSQPIEIHSETLINIILFLKTHPWPLFLNKIFSCWLIGVGWAPNLKRRLFSLWPPIEFDFGPEHLKIEKIRREQINLFIITAVIPIILSIVYDIGKGLI